MDKTFVETDEKFRKIHRKIPVLEFFLIKFETLRFAALLKSDSSKGDFLHFFHKTHMHLWWSLFE